MAQAGRALRKGKLAKVKPTLDAFGKDRCAAAPRRSASSASACRRRRQSSCASSRRCWSASTGEGLKLQRKLDMQRKQAEAERKREEQKAKGWLWASMVGRNCWARLVRASSF